MRVFYFITKSGEGGAQTVIAELLHGHKTRGDEVCVMASGEGWLATYTKTLEFTYIENSSMRKSYNPFVIFKAASKYRNAVVAWKPDIVSVHSSFSGFIGRIALLGKKTVVYTTHGWGFTYAYSALKVFNILVEKIAALFCAAIICVSKRDKRIAQQYRIAPERKLFTIYNGVSTESIEKRGNAGLSVGFLGRIAHPKRQEFFLEAFALVPEEIKKQTTLLFIGGGDVERLKEKTKALGLSTQTIITGELSRDEALAHLSTCSCSVLVSFSEGFPMAVIEALQLGVPVIANAVGGISEVVDTSVGRLLPANLTVHALSNAIAELLEKKELREELSKNARKRGEEFSAKQMCSETFALYERLLLTR